MPVGQRHNLNTHSRDESKSTVSSNWKPQRSAVGQSAGKNSDRCCESESLGNTGFSCFHWAKAWSFGGKKKRKRLNLKDTNLKDTYLIFLRIKLTTRKTKTRPGTAVSCPPEWLERLEFGTSACRDDLYGHSPQGRQDFPWVSLSSQWLHEALLAPFQWWVTDWVTRATQLAPRGSSKAQPMVWLLGLHVLLRWYVGCCQSHINYFLTLSIHSLSMASSSLQ